MNKFCPDNKCNFWKVFPDGVPKQLCPHCSKDLLTEKTQSKLQTKSDRIPTHSKFESKQPVKKLYSVPNPTSIPLASDEIKNSQKRRKLPETDTTDAMPTPISSDCPKEKKRKISKSNSPVVDLTNPENKTTSESVQHEHSDIENPFQTTADSRTVELTTRVNTQKRNIDQVSQSPEHLPDTSMCKRKGDEQSVALSNIIHSEMDPNETEYVSIQFTTLILEEHWENVVSICLKIGHDYFDNFKSSIVPFSRVKNIIITDNKFVIISGTLKFPLKHVSKNVIKFPYRYCIYSNDGNESCEHLSHNDKMVNRYFSWNIDTCPIALVDQGIYQQYDVMVLPEICKKEDPTLWGFVISAFNYVTPAGWKVRDVPFNNLDERRLVSLQAFLPSFLGLGQSQPCDTLEEFILHFNTQLKNVTRYNPGSKVNVDQSNKMRLLIESWIMATYTADRIAKSDPRETILYFYLACYLIESHSLTSRDLHLKVMSVVEESIESILKNRSYILDTSVCSEGKVRTDIHSAIVNFIFNKVIKMPEKLLMLIPIYHGISNIGEQANRLHDELSYHVNEYWGLPNGIEWNWNATISIDSIKEAITLVKYDDILPYAIILYALSEQNVDILCEHFFWKTPHLPLSVLISALLFRLEYSNGNRLSLQMFNKLTTKVLEALTTALNISEDNLDNNDVIRLIELTVNLTNKLPLKQFNPEQFKLCLGLLSHCYKCTHSDASSTQLDDKIGYFFRYFVKNWYPIHISKNNNSFTFLLTEIEFWEEILTNYTFPTFVKWTDIIREFLVNKFKDQKIPQKVIIDLFIFLHNKEIHPALLQELFLRELTTRLQSTSSDEKNSLVRRLYDQLLDRGQMPKVNSIFSKILLDEKLTFILNSLQHFLTWPAWETYFCILSSKNAKQILSVDAYTMLESVSIQFSSLFEKLSTFKFTGVEIQLIIQNKKNFFTLTNHVLKSTECTYTIENIQNKFDLCLEMHDWITEQYTALRHLNDFIRSLQNINNEVISSFLSLNWNKKSIRNVCYSHEDSYLFVKFPEINQIIIFRGFKFITTACVSLKESRLALSVFDKFIRAKRIQMRSPFRIKYFHKELWKPAYEICIKLRDKFIFETILIAEMCEYFDSSKSLTVIIKELTLFATACRGYQLDIPYDSSLMEPCAQKVNLYFRLQQCSLAAKLIIELKNRLLITSNFGILEKLQNISSTYKDKQLMNIIDKRNVAELRNLSKSNLDVIQAIIDRIDFIMWIRSNLKDLNELKTFVDISLTTCGGNPVDVDRITCLSSVCTNFAPIIFQIDENTSYETLIARCRQVMESVERNKELTKLLRQVGENVTFWEEMKRSHGSVEETTLMQLASIMKSGQFDVKLGDSLNLCDIVSLSVERENSEKRLYSLEQLREFRSKLMLVVSKTELPGLDTYTGSYENSQLFTHKLDTLTEIATIVIQLAETGNQRYLKYELHSDCNQQEDTLMETKDKLRNTLEDWRANVEEARNRHYFLNYYTISQIVFLQKGIKSFIEEREDRDLEQLYHLLGLLNPDVSKQDIQQSLEQSDIVSKPKYTQFDYSGISSDFSRQSIFAALSTRHSHITPTKSKAEHFRRYNTTQTELTNSLSLTEKELADKVSGSDLPLTLAIRGISEIKSNNGIVSERNLLTWCIEHEMDTDTELMDDGTISRLDSGCILTNESYRKVPLDLDFCQLGTFLNNIYQSGVIRSERELPYNLKSGSPNLVVIPSAGMLEFVLSLYMSDNDKLPLPYYHEILICTPQTRLEEIEIFWRRAVMIPDRLNLFLFCLIGIENLSYDVAVQAVAKLKRFQQNPEQIGSYKLVLLCSEEKEEYSYMAAALDDCKHSFFFTRKSQQIKQYLSLKLSNSQRRSIFIKSKPAWMVDRKNSRVRLVVSDSVGAGKSLYINNLKSDLLSQGIVSEEEMEQSAVTVAIHGKQASEEHLAAQLLKRRVSGVKHGVMYHVDIASTVQLCLEPILFKLLILGGICKRSGELWHCRGRDYYVIEMTLGSGQYVLAQFTRLFPNEQCIQPHNALKTNDLRIFDTYDMNNLQYQRVCAYLRRFEGRLDLNDYTFQQSGSSWNSSDILSVLFRFCGLAKPSWSEIRNFVYFLDKQLSDCDISDYCQSGIMGQEWRGFKSFVVNLMIIMSRDFATPSLKAENIESHPDALTHFEIMKIKKWENNSHPYIFFNPDGHTMTFLGFHISNQGHLVDSDNPSHVIEANIMHPQLLQILTANQVNLQENFNKLDKLQKIMKLAGVIGIEWIADPDPGYVLTLDNMRKILAILMRFRCNIPVVIMGETGCGKTRLIQFMCSLQALQTGACNMLILKVHGGTTETDVMSKVEEAGKLAERNYAAHQIDTVLFFDEANTSPAIGLIKEIMCDRRMYGRHIRTDIGLQFIAACNPYRRHTEEMLNKLSSAGLGFFTKASETTDRLGDIPLRELVYRVMELPASFRPLVWDFGQLSNSIEKTYTREIVARHLRERNSPIEARDEIVDAISDVLAGAQNYMRERKDECSFVSLRDVERAMRVMLWFYSNLKYFRPERHSHRPIERLNGIDPITYSLIISLFVCYRARLQERDEFDKHVIKIIRDPLTPIDDYQVLHREVDRCQGLLLHEMTIGANIAKNTALKENVFMMFVCIELKIPLFVIGKPGSSKSLAKSIISNSMQGSRCPDDSILQNFKQVQIMSYQCSQLSTADGIIGVFNSCRKLQRKTGSNKFTACVVLDEVGLAEDSPLLPLKVLHPLLEDSSYGSEDAVVTDELVQDPIDIDLNSDNRVDELTSQVAFIGISNWSLDPAKMNRGIMLSRGDPDIEELVFSAKGICQSTSVARHIVWSIEIHVLYLALAYQKLILTKDGFKHTKMRDFFGLRDFYCLIKMLVFICGENSISLNRSILEHSVRRNFGGVSCIDAVAVYLDTVKLPRNSYHCHNSTPLGLISANLKNLSRSYHGETRYLLLLTENYAALNILFRSRDMWPKQQDIESIRVIFGSSFPCDQEYSAVCRNINRIKVCMESGKTVILLNLENLYESLYDALNQYYMEMNNQRYVDLGLGTHRMKCRVHNDFKLIVVADKQTVQERFPTPLINRLEKHILTMSTVLTEDGLIISKQLADWADKFSTLDKTHFCGIQKRGDFTVGDCFIGYHNDTPSSIVFHVMKEMYPEGMPTESRIDATAVLERSQTQLLRMATTDAVLRVKNSLLSLQSEQIIAKYFKLQLGSLEEYLSQVLSGICGSETGTHLTLATTHSRLLTERDIDQLQQRLSTDTDSLQIRSLSLQQFQTEQQYIREVQKFLRGEDSERERRETTHRKILLVQCERGAENGKLIACARHKTVDELKDWREEQRGELKCEVFLLFLVQLSREAHGSKFMSFCGGDWNTVHIDDVRSLDYTEMPPISQLIGRQILELIDGPTLVSLCLIILCFARLF